MAKLRVFLADDHPVVRGGLRALIDAQPDMEVVGEAADGEAAVLGVLDTGPDVAVLDVSMPEVSGAEATARIRRDRPAVRVLALSAHEDIGYVRQVLAAGASGYVVKRAAAEDLVRAIRRVAAGETYLDPAIAGALVVGLVRAPAGGPAAGAELSEREAEVLRRVALGHPLKQVAADLDVGVRTVETYKARAMEKLGLRTRADVVRYAAMRGWLAGG
ncbi:response regulator transcription factor [Tautonia plasticadhaerens]|uniref:Oxygen regulatory protein NreC n=1 Tax=Tautonia plasticadhaerens TaxID=2527974 RepID=A0A518HFG9_9BACT|nr:response regulator transcription factor [Tautonia plasticadhaerens]QDV39590.1 Oxygen regulatory protein NreC [Tautonia plasticadhaerens]